MSTVQTMCETQWGKGWKYVPSRCGNSTDQFIIMYKMKSIKVQMKCVFFIAEFERAAKIRKIAVYRFKDERQQIG